MSGFRLGRGMFNFVRYVACALIFPSAVIAAENPSVDSEDKVVSGMSILGNDETPKSLYIVPWKSTGDGTAKNLTSGNLDDEIEPVDKDEFIRELENYRDRNPG